MVDTLIQKMIEKQNPTVAGLDPQLSYIPDEIKQDAVHRYGRTLEGAAYALLQFNRGLIDALYDVVPAVKPQSAYYEMYGWEGVRALHDTIQYARSKGLYVIADVKRNDIGTTAEAYAKAYLGETDVFGQPSRAFGCDAATVNAYLGSDGILPFLKWCERGGMIFALVKTSNRSASELQDRVFEDGLTLYQTVGKKVEEWGSELTGGYGYSAAGAVVGATYPKELETLRRELPHTFFLVPGYRAQGGGAKDVAGGFDSRGLGAVINSSRGIMCAWQKQGGDFAEAARAEALRMKEELLSVLGGRIG